MGHGDYSASVLIQGDLIFKLAYCHRQPSATTLNQNSVHFRIALILVEVWDQTRISLINLDHI
jgi:hypothetical protein